MIFQIAENTDIFEFSGASMHSREAKNTENFYFAESYSPKY